MMLGLSGMAQAMGSTAAPACGAAPGAAIGEAEVARVCALWSAALGSAPVAVQRDPPALRIVALDATGLDLRLEGGPLFTSQDRSVSVSDTRLDDAIIERFLHSLLTDLPVP